MAGWIRRRFGRNPTDSKENQVNEVPRALISEDRKVEAQKQRESVGVEKKVACLDGLLLKLGKRETNWIRGLGFPSLSPLSAAPTYKLSGLAIFRDTMANLDCSRSFTTQSGTTLVGLNDLHREIDLLATYKARTDRAESSIHRPSRKNQ